MKVKLYFTNSYTYMWDLTLYIFWTLYVIQKPLTNQSLPILYIKVRTNDSFNPKQLYLHSFNASALHQIIAGLESYILQLTTIIVLITYVHSNI